MFVEDLRNDFYNVLLGKRVLLLVHYDVDAICTCKILQGLFKCDNISYTLVPVGGVSELKTAYEENNEEIKYVVLVNCGGTIDLVDILQPEEDVVFFVLDCHKPTDICNVYSDGQVRIVYKDSEENIPNFDDIFRDDEDEEEEPRESGMEALEAAMERRRGRRAWEERRHTLMFNYTQFSYYGKPSACVALEVAWMVSRCGWAALWAASVAAAAHVALALRAPAQCLLDADALHRRIAAAQHAPADTSCRVVLEKDSWLPLYRVWSLEGALKHAPSIAPHLKLHTHAGAARLRQLLADMGIPLQQARQAYRSMDVELRHSATSALEAAAERLRLPAPARAAFLLQRPHAPPLPAHDATYALLALMHHLSSESKVCLKCIEIIRTQAQEEHPIRDYGHKSVCLGCGISVLRARSIHINRNRPEFNIIERWVPQIQETIPQGEGFQHALAALDVEGGINDSLRLGLEGARAALEAVARLAHATLSGRRLQLAGPFSYFIVQEGVPEARWVRGPHWLGVAARWVAAATGGARPLVASAPRDHATCILLGVPPRVEQEPRNLFGAAFEQAATKSGASVSLDLMDSSVITLPTAQRPQFLDALTALLA